MGIESEFGAGMEMGTDDWGSEGRALAGERILGGVSGLLGRGIGFGVGCGFVDAGMWI